MSEGLKLFWSMGIKLKMELVVVCGMVLLRFASVKLLRFIPDDTGGGGTGDGVTSEVAIRAGECGKKGVG